MSRIQSAIEARRRTGRVAFIPFLTAGFPDRPTTVRAAVALAEAGADVLEIGIPFSDPVADGPVIQHCSEVALRGETTPERALEVVAAIRRATTIPIVVMTYLNPVMQFRGPAGERFGAAARAAGADGILLTDLPPDQPHECWEEVAAAGLDPILLVTPTTPRSRLAALAGRARGFVYGVARLGVTGEGPGAHARLEEMVAAARAAIGLPVVVGFGIATPEDARRVAGLADGVVVGSALLRRIEGAADPVAAARALAAELIPALTVAQDTP